MTSLATADLHLDDTPRNQYRWDILSWLENKATQLSCDLILVVGDLTDAKDKHSHRIVNRLVDFLHGSANQWVFVTGNHDYVEPSKPFFRFLDHLENVRWVVKPTRMKLPVALDYGETLLLPATADAEAEWRPLLNVKVLYEYVFMHGTFAGTLSETGYELPGLRRDFFDMTKIGRVYAGDIHVPGVVAPRIESLGAPYRVRFGDHYEPRVVHIGKRDIRNLYPKLLMRHVVEVRNTDDLDKYDEVLSGDQVKIRVKLKRNQLVEWKRMRREIYDAAGKLGWEVCGIEPMKITSSRQRLNDVPEPQPGQFRSAEEHVAAFGEKHNLKKRSIDYGLQFLPHAA